MASMRSIGVRLRLLVDAYKRDVDEAKKKNEELGDSGKRAKAALDDLAGTLTIVGGALVAAAGAVVYTTARFDKSMSEVKAVSGATAEEFAALREAALAAGAATVFSASESANAMAELAKAGVSVKDILGGALFGTLDLAAAGTLELAEAAEIAAKTMNTFGLRGQDVTHIADVLAAAANKSATSVQELGIGLQQVGLVANQVGFSMEETVGLLAAFADRGLAGSDGATSLKTALLRLAAPTGEAAELLKQYGISLYDANGQMVDAVTIAGQLEKGLSSLSAAERNAALNIIFGADAIRAANVLYGLGADGVREYIDAVNDTGAAARVAEEKLNNLAGDVQLLQSALEGLFIRSGEATGPLRWMVQGATDLTNAFAGLPGPLQATVVGVAGVTGAGMLATAAAIKLRSGVDNLIESLSNAAIVGPKAAAGLRSLANAASIAGITLTSALIAGQIIDDLVDDEIVPAMDALEAGLMRWNRGAKLGGEAARVLGEDFQELDNAMATLTRWPGWLTGAFAQLQAFGAQGILDVEGMRARVAAFDGALASMVQSGNLAKANELFAMQAAKFEAAGYPIERLNDLLPQYRAALEAVGPEAQLEAELAANLAAQNIRLAGAFGEAANEADGLRNAFLRLNGGVLGWRDAERDAEAAADNLIDALKESNGSLDVTDKKGRAAAAAVDALAIAAAEAAQAKYNETHSVEQANAVYEHYIGQLRQILLNAGLAEAEVEALIGQIARMPSYKPIVIDFQVRNAPTGELAMRTRGGWIPLAKGGIVKAARGRLDAGVVTSPTVLFGERETGGEAFIPRKGVSRNRALSILQEAASWHGASVIPSSVAAPAMSTVDVRLSWADGGDTPLQRAITDLIRIDVTRAGGGSVQGRYGVRGRVA